MKKLLIYLLLALLAMGCAQHTCPTYSNNSYETHDFKS